MASLAGLRVANTCSMPYCECMTRPPSDLDQWTRLGIYRQRYPIDDRLHPVVALERSLQRRRVRAAALVKRLEQLEKVVSETRDELAAIDNEIEGARRVGALLIEELLDEVQSEMEEAWSPTPVHGFRVWRIEDNRIMGNRVHWASPTLESRCLREIPGEDLPHPVEFCGPPACGIYAVKDLEFFPTEVARGNIHDSVVGVVALYGKVIEHEGGYRSRKAKVVAVSVNDGRRRLMTDDPVVIGELFAEPEKAMVGYGRLSEEEKDTTQDFLKSIRAKEESWI